MSEVAVTGRGAFGARAMLLDYLRREKPIPRSAEERARWETAIRTSARGLRAGRQLLRAGNASAATPLLREASKPVWPLWQEEERTRSTRAASLNERDRESLDEALTPSAPEDLDALPRAEIDERATRLCEALTELVALAEHALESERVLTLRASARRAYLALSLVAIVVFIVLSAGAYHHFEPPNLARGARVTASPPGFGTVPERVIDGFRYGQLGYHSVDQRNPWLSIDIGREQGIGRIIAYGRTDCCLDESIPLEVELSIDDKHFQQVARRDKPFSAFDPWEIVLPPGTRARYVRFTARKYGHLMLSEVEILPGK